MFMREFYPRTCASRGSILDAFRIYSMAFSVWPSCTYMCPRTYNKKKLASKNKERFKCEADLHIEQLRQCSFINSLSESRNYQD